LYAKLHDTLDIETGVMDELYGMGILNAELFQRLHKASGYHEKNEIFLKFLMKICDPETFRTILIILADSNQQHIVNYIISGGGKYEPIYIKFFKIL
jgi:hypothetical protein